VSFGGGNEEKGDNEEKESSTPIKTPLLARTKSGTMQVRKNIIFSAHDPIAFPFAMRKSDGRFWRDFFGREIKRWCVV
jgi:hypothetical protein